MNVLMNPRTVWRCGDGIGEMVERGWPQTAAREPRPPAFARWDRVGARGTQADGEGEHQTSEASKRGRVVAGDRVRALSRPLDRRRRQALGPRGKRGERAPVSDRESAEFGGGGE